MFEDKVKIEFPAVADSTFEFGGQKVKVVPYISDNDQRSLIGVYVHELFLEQEDMKYNFLNAENALKISIIELCTNIQVVDSEGKTPLFSLNDVFGSTLMQNIIPNILNYKEFRSRLDSTVEMLRESKRIDSSLGNKLDLIYAKVSGFISDILEGDFSPEKIESIKSMLKEINSSPILENVSKMVAGESKS